MKRLRVYNIEIPLGSSDKALYRAVLRRLGVDRNKIGNITLTSRAIDSRRHTPRYNCTAEVELKQGFEEEVLKRLEGFRNILEAPEVPAFEFPIGEVPLGERPVIVGSGPAGLFAAYALAKQGYKPLLIERGKAADERLRQIGRFNSGNAELDPEANTQFGEGGAGTFSDGKLYTRKNKDPHLTNVLRILVEHGAPEEILIDASPHVGTDLLAGVIVKLRKHIEAMGAEVRFLTTLHDVEINDGQLEALHINDERVPCHVCILATGHSARAVYGMLKENGVTMEAKPFQFGVRIEHPQSFINERQYGVHQGHPDLGAAEYFLTCAKNPNLPEVHSFCMCPGGMIVPAVDTEGELVTNGMSFSLRNRPFANAGLVSTFHPKDFGGESDALAGIAFQRQYERMAYEAGGGNWVCPAQPASDFLTGLKMRREMDGTYPLGRRYVDISSILPQTFVKGLAYALRHFDDIMPGFAGNDAILHAVESRGSCPVRISRNPQTRESVSCQGLFPAGEGAGFAGGIVSAALDGIHTAAAIMQRFAPAVVA